MGKFRIVRQFRQNSTKICRKLFLDIFGKLANANAPPICQQLFFDMNRHSTLLKIYHRFCRKMSNEIVKKITQILSKNVCEIFIIRHCEKNINFVEKCKMQVRLPQLAFFYSSMWFIAISSSFIILLHI